MSTFCGSSLITKGCVCELHRGEERKESPRDVGWCLCLVLTLVLCALSKLSTALLMGNRCEDVVPICELLSALCLKLGIRDVTIALISLGGITELTVWAGRKRYFGLRKVQNTWLSICHKV